MTQYDLTLNGDEDSGESGNSGTDAGFSEAGVGENFNAASYSSDVAVSEADVGCELNVEA